MARASHRWICSALLLILPMQILGLVDRARADPAIESGAIVPASAATVGVTGPAPVALSPTSGPPAVAAPPMTAGPPAPVPPVVPAPRPAPTTPPTTTARIESVAETSAERTARAFATAVPDRWRSDIPIHFESGEGWTSWAYPGGRIVIGRQHAEARFELLVDVVAHEFGHQIAFRYGSGAYLGAPPTGWPSPDHHPAEAWADCVQTVFTGRSNPSHGLPACGGDRLAWAAEWLASLPG